MSTLVSKHFISVAQLKKEKRNQKLQNHLKIWKKNIELNIFPHPVRANHLPEDNKKKSSLNDGIV